MSTPPDNPPPLDYSPPTGRPAERGPRWFWLGIVAGLGISIVAWPAEIAGLNNVRNLDGGTIFWVTVITIPLIKMVIAYVVGRHKPRRAFASGIVLSIALAPLLAIGAVAVLCGVIVSRG